MGTGAQHTQADEYFTLNGNFGGYFLRENIMFPAQRDQMLEQGKGKTKFPPKFLAHFFPRIVDVGVLNHLPV